jgi:putative membrane protein
MKKLVAVLTTVLFLVAFTPMVIAAEKEPSPDKKFMEKAAMGGMYEVEAGKVAAQKASSEEVKKFGQRMVDDHTKANDELTQLADKKGVKVPKDLDKKFKAKVEKLSKLSGADFDREYMNMMVKDHKEDIAEFSKEAKNGKDPDVKALASKTLPTLQEHLKMAEDLAGKAGKK